MTKEAKEKWLEECRKADLEIEKQICKENKQAYEKSKERKKKYYLKNKDKMREYQRDWQKRHKKEVSEKRKAARLLQKSNGANKNTFNQILI